MNGKTFFLVLALMFLASPMFGQDGRNVNWVALSAGPSMAIASGLCGLAQGRAIAGAAEGMARNPSATAAVRLALILGLALIESLALLTFVIILIKVV